MKAAGNEASGFFRFRVEPRRRFALPECEECQFMLDMLDRFGMYQLWINCPRTDCGLSRLEGGLSRLVQIRTGILKLSLLTCHFIVVIKLNKTEES